MNRTAVAGLIIALVAVSGVGTYYFVFIATGCNPDSATVTDTFPTHASNFGAITEYSLPRTGDWANGITVGSDGSVWFGEQALPGVARYDPSNNTFTEYRWSCYGPAQSKGPVTSIWGIAQWNGRIWAADGDGNRLIGLDPSKGSLRYVNTTTAKFPYLLAPAPDGSLWFTTLSTRALLGKLGQDLSLTVLSVSGLGKEEPIQVLFVNETLAYMVALSSSGQGGLYSFDPQAAGGTIQAAPVGSNFTLLSPDSLSMVGDQIWITQHYPSNVVEYDMSTKQWTVFPTSLANFTYTTLPYFVDATPQGIWLNEHYANKIGIIDLSAGTMTEYSESDPPVTNGSKIGNDLTIAAVPGGLWFTSTTGDYLGFANGGYSPTFSLAAAGSDSLRLAPGGSGDVRLLLSGSSGAPLNVQVSDSENITSVPKLISIQPDRTIVPLGSGNTSLGVMIRAADTLPPGRYTVDITVTDGLVFQTVFVFLTVT